MAIEQSTTVVHRNITYRLIPGTRARARKLAATAGACRYVWNRALGENRDAMQAYRDGKGEKPSVSFFSLGKWFTQLRHETPWLMDLPANPIKYTLKRQADAWQACFRDGGFPRFKSRRGDDSVTLPSGTVLIRDGKLHFPKIGPMVLRRRGGNPYPEGEPVQVIVKRCLGKWHATVCYAVPATDVPDNGLALGVDMNVGQIAISTGDILRAPDVSRLEARRRRYQRMMARRCKGSKRRAVARDRAGKTARRIANIRHNWHHHVSRQLADSAGLVCIEDLRPKAMTASAKGTAVCPGRNVRQKAGLNRSILATGWGQLRRMLEYKAAEVRSVLPAYTSQTCNACGVIDAASRKSQSVFECAHCGWAGNADVNAALNILASGTGATGRRGALALAGHSRDPSNGVSESRC